MILLKIGNIYKLRARVNLFIFALLFLCARTFAQTVVKSQLKDKNGIPVANAHVFINQSTGTVTNKSGYFKLMIEARFKQTLVKISAIGYQTLIIPASEVSEVTIINKAEVVLDEVVISPIDHARELVKSAIAAIPQNYPNFDEHHIGFLRETTSWENKRKAPLYVVEATLESHKNSYNQKRIDRSVKILKSRSYNTHGLDSVFTKIIAGTHHSHRFDVVAGRNVFLSNTKMFQFEILDTLRFQGKNVFKIYFKHKAKSSPYGYAYIVDGTYAFAKFEVHFPSNFPLWYRHKSRIAFKYTSQYFIDEHKYWRFLQSDYETSFKKNKDTLVLESQYVTTSYERNATKIPYLDRFQSNEAILESQGIYDSSFWNSYKILLPDENIEDLFQKSNQIRTDGPSISKREKFLKILSKINLGYAVNGSKLRVAGYDLTYANDALSIQHTERSSEQLIWGLSSFFLYEFRPHTFIGLTTENPITKNGLLSYDLSISKDFNINPNGRPIKISPGIRMGYQQLNQSIGNFSSETEYSIHGKAFDSGNTKVSLTQKQMHVQPNLTFSMEKSNRLHFFSSINYNIPFNRKTGLTFTEKGEFIFRKKQFLKNENGGLTIERTGSDILSYHVNITTGIFLRF